uniref:beta strand repeat-containing protein n=1 Tax=Lonepinella sp. BR2882 TaxID=3095283 RepID=UPI003F6DAC89
MNHIYKVIWSQVANAFIAVSELASSRGKTNAIKTATPVSSIMNATTQIGLPFKLDKIAALTVLFMSPFYATAADVNADNLTVSGTASVTGTSTFIGAATFNGGITTDSLTVNGTDISNKISTLETDISSKANQTDLTTLSNKVDNKADQSALTTLKNTVDTKANQSDVTTLTATVATKADQSAVDSLKSTVDTKANQSEVTALTATVATKASQTDLNNLNTKVTTLDSTKADKTELNTLNNTVIANKALFDTLNASVNTLGLTSTYSGIKYFRVNSTAADAQATGDNALAAGPEAIANASKAVAVGHQAHATHENSTALGSNARATGNNAVATGYYSNAKANNSVVMGNHSSSQNNATKSVAIGNSARTGSNDTGGDVTYDGASSYVFDDGKSSIAIGDNSTARGNSNIAIGKDAVTANKDAETAFATNSIAMGTSAKTIASSSAIAIGNDAVVQKYSDSAIAIGDNAKVAATTAVAVGPNTTASGVASTAVGSSATAGGASATAIGSNSTASAPSGVAIGDSASSAASKTISIGLNAGKGQQADISGTKNSHINIGELSGENVDGQLNIAIGKQAGSNVRGKGNIAVGTEAGMNIVGSDESLGDNVAIGTKANSYSTQTNVQFATALGALTTASSGSSALGYTANATGEKSVAVGYGANASGSQSLALGLNSNASGVDNVALGSTSVAATKSGTGYLTGNVSDTVVSVGNDNLSRRIVNVADGADDSDAVTVAQLKKVSDDVYNKVNTQINSLSITAGSGINYDNAPRTTTENSITLSKDNKKTIIGSVADGVLDDDAVNLGQLKSEISKEKTHYFSTNVNGSELGNYNNNGATGNVSLAAGQEVLASGDNSIAIGNYVTAQSTGSIAIGSKYEGSAALDDGVAKPSETKTISGSQVFQYNMAIGAGASSEGNNSIAIGSLASTSTKDATTENVDRAIALGYYAVSSAEKANAIGDRARSTGLTSNAFGSEANATGTSSTAIGTTAQASGTNSIAFGTNQKVSGTNSGSIGYAGDGTTANTTSVSGSGTYSVGNMNSGITAKESGVFGNDNVLKTSDNTRVVGNTNEIGNVTTATPGGATPVNNLKDIYVTGYGNTISSGEKLAEDLSGLFVYGHNNTVAQIDDAASTEKVEITDSSIIGANNTLNTSGSDYFILGNNVTATLQNSVYLGNASAYVASGTSTKGMDSYASIVDNSATYTFAGSTPTGVVTVGAVGQERRVQNVAAGLVTSASTDAINGSQLYALTRPLRFAGDNSALSNQDGGNVTQNADTNVISRNSNQAIDITGGETDASKLTTKTDKNIGVIVTDNNSMEIRLAKELTNLTNATFGTGSDSTVINKDGVTITNGGTTVKLTEAGLDNGNNKIINVSPGVSGTDAVNVNQLEAVNATANAGWKLQANGSGESTVKPNATVSLNNTDNNIVISKNAADNNVTFGLNSTVTVKGSGAGNVTLDGSNGTISLADKDGSSNTTIAVTNSGAKDLDGKEITRITYNTTVGGNTVIEQIATLNDGLYFEGDTGTKVTRKLTQTLNISGGATGSVAANNIKVTSDNDSGSLLVQLAKDLNLTD